MDPLSEIHATYLLKQVGRMVFSSTLVSLKKFANVRGCVLLDLDKPILGEVEVDVVDEGVIRIEVAYRSLLFMCDFYHEKGHPDKLCVRRRKKRERTKMLDELEHVKKLVTRA